METSLLYLAQVSVCMALLYTLYFALLRRTTFFHWNRAYLILILILSCLIPLFSYETTQTIEVAPNIENSSYLNSENSNNEIIEIPINENQASGISEIHEPINWFEIVGWLYLMGIVLMSFLFAQKITKIISLIRSTETLVWFKNNKIRLLQTDNSLANSSFFQYIFINVNGLTETEIEQIIQHEYWHFRLKHSYDILFIEVMKVLFWANPAIYLIKKSLMEVHEFQVDEKVVNQFDSSEYAHLLLKLAIPQNTSFINQFSTQPLKSRIIFLFTKRSNTMKRLFYLGMLPMIAIGLVAFAKEEIRVIYLKIENEYSAPKISSIKVFGWKYHQYPKDFISFRNNRINSIKEKNINQLEFKNLSGFNYYLSSDLLSEEVINETNEYIKQKGIELSYELNQGRIKIDLKNRQTNQIISGKYYNVDWLKNQRNGYFLISAFADKWESSDIKFNYTIGQLQISDASNVPDIYLLNPKSANIGIDKQKIRAFLNPDMITFENLDIIAENFKKYQFQIDYKLKVRLHEILEMNVSMLDEIKQNQSQSQFYLNDFRHLIRLKSEPKSKFTRMDETIVFEGNFKTREVKIYIENRWFNGIKKSGKYDIIGVPISNLTPKIDSSNSGFQNYLGIKSQNYGTFSASKILPRVENVSYSIFNNDGVNDTEKFTILNLPPNADKSPIKVTAGNIELQSNVDYFIANGVIKISNDAIKRNGQPLNIHFEKPPIINMKVTKTFGIWDTKFRYSTGHNLTFPRKNNDTLRTIYEANFLGKNPLVILNGEEVPPSILTRLNSKTFGWSAIYLANHPKTIEKFGNKAPDGAIEIRTIDEPYYKNETERQVARENIRRRIMANLNSERLVRYSLQSNSTTENEGIIIKGISNNTFGFTTEVEKKGRILYVLNNKFVDEETIKNLPLSVPFKKVFSYKYPKDKQAFEKRVGKIQENYDLIIELFTD